ncbi:hypothetical protein EFZ10_06060 [Tatumella sp. TA1]|nr:hypothetical protein EFZ10_06060 [Tatumella sp. TA1]
MYKRKASKKSFIKAPGGFVWKPMYEKCPCCGFDLNKVPDSLVKKVEDEEANDDTSRAKGSFVTIAFKSLARYWHKKSAI